MNAHGLPARAAVRVENLVKLVLIFDELAGFVMRSSMAYDVNVVFWMLAMR
jgi:hypothetical protein